MAFDLCAKCCIDDPEPIHCMFGLTRSSYLVLQRSLMEAMPLYWQRRFTAVVAEMEAEFDLSRAATTYRVEATDLEDRVIDDPLAEYRHPDRDLIASLRRKRQEAEDGSA